MKEKKAKLGIWIAGGFLGLSIFLYFYTSTNIEASIDLSISRSKAIKLADAFIEKQGFYPSHFEKTIMFGGCDTSYLQQKVGAKKTNELLQNTIPCWWWDIRYFKELREEGFYISVDTATGGIINFYHTVPEDSKGANLTQEEARGIAESFLISQGEKVSDYTLRKKSTNGLKNRTDHNFIWVKKGFKIEEASLQTEVSIQGDKLGYYSTYLRVPEHFYRNLAKKTAKGIFLSFGSAFGTFILLVAAIISLIIHRRRRIHWKLAFWFAIIPLPLFLLNFWNGLPLFWAGYTTTLSKGVFLFFGIAIMLFASVFVFFTIFLFFAAGELMSRVVKHRSMPIFRGIMRRRLKFKDVFPRLVIGYSLGFCHLGYVTVFYLIAVRYFNVWKPLTPAYSDILTTSMPFLYPLTVALMAAWSEELIYRWFAISFFRRYSSSLWFALLIPALIWGFGHSSYPVFPMYIRGIELSIIGVIWGIVYLRYGIETTIIAHYVYNAVIASVPLLTSNNTYFIFSGLVVIFLLFVPAVLLPLLAKPKLPLRKVTLPV